MKRVLFHLLMVIVVVALAGCSTLPTAAPFPPAETQVAADRDASGSCKGGHARAVSARLHRWVWV